MSTACALFYHPAARPQNENFQGHLFNCFRSVFIFYEKKVRKLTKGRSLCIVIYAYIIKASKIEKNQHFEVGNRNEMSHSNKMKGSDEFFLHRIVN